MSPLVFTKLIRQSYKMVGFAGYIATYMAGAWVILFIPTSDWNHRRHLARWSSFMSRRTLKLLRIHITKKETAGTRAAKKLNNHFIVSNHLGYLDILVISADTPSCFVTSVELRDTPFLGFLSQLAGCLYVERRDRSNIHNEIRDVTEGLLNGLNVCVFPEATSTNGDAVLRFRQPLYNAAIQSDTDVLPVCLNYTHIDGTPVTSENRDSIFWYGDMPFLSHLWQLMGHKKIEMQLNYDETIAPSDLDCPKLLAARTHLVVSSLFKKPVTC